MESLEKFLKSLKVTYEIPRMPSTRRVYRVNGLDGPAANVTFSSDGQMMSVAKYFETQKRFKLRYPNLPTVWVGAQSRENKILLPLELCTLTEGQVSINVVIYFHFLLFNDIYQQSISIHSNIKIFLILRYSKGR